MYKYGLSVKFRSTENNAQKLSSILLKASELVSRAKGCQLYLVSIDSEDPDTVWSTEVWDSKEDHDNSLSVIGVKELISQAMPLFAAPPEKVKEIKILGGYGINP
ncbi:quinol monooxygenase YgiN [Gillisia mitskevichiae]|uniref:Quinol monooxygenase YgiN n=1 Tax=Gillisia mitskevichiae TaxID=270921 RepID=A0A495PL69_9FLAO|nr:antibiotic biosynthesis monooxygenase [Gillisia mitskevichiae]RKS50736.1 quinol monooxygenase YgiN [Gillisia mitskevichiae]